MTKLERLDCEFKTTHDVNPHTPMAIKIASIISVLEYFSGSGSGIDVLSPWMSKATLQVSSSLFGYIVRQLRGST